MNKFKKKTKIIVLMLTGFFFTFTSCAQKNLSQRAETNKTPLPFSEDIKTGTLKNGMKYYLMKNKYPEKRVEFRLNVRSGSLNETDQEQGLAHFVEHMAFNGTKHFKHNELIDFLEDAGLTFGQHSNAYTSTNVTNYQLSLQSDRKDLIDKAYVIMSDWADGLLFNEDEIEKEKGVITEEWRMRKSASSRIGKKIREVMLDGSRYPLRDPIGKMEIVQNANRELLKGYYDKWYTPENMSVIIVGDIDIDETEQKVKNAFLGIKSRKTPEKADETTPYIKGLRVVAASDEEASGIRVAMNYMWKSSKITDYELYKNRIHKEIALSLFSKRMNRKITDKELPMIRSFAFASDLVPGTDSGRFIFIPANKKVKPGLFALFTEIKRAQDFGFTDTELQEYIKERKQVLANYANPEKRYESSHLAGQIISYDLENTYLMSPQQQLEIFNKITNETKLDQINKSFNEVVSAKSKVASIVLPDSDKDLAFTKDEVETIMNKASSQTLEPYFIEKAKENFMDHKPNPGSVKFHEAIKSVDADIYTLSNNVKIIIKKTDFNPGEFFITGIKKGGLSAIDDKNYKTAMHAAEIIDRSGFKNIDPKDIPRLLAGKKVNITPKTEVYTQTFSGSAYKKEAETLFQMLHLYFTEPNVDEKALSNYKINLKEMVQAQSENKMFNFMQDAQQKIHNKNFRTSKMTYEDINLLTKDKIMSLYTKMFGDINNFTFTITGDVDKNEIIELARTYLGSVKPIDVKADYKDRNVRLKENNSGKNKVIYGTGEVENRATVKMIFEEAADFSIEDSTKFSLLRKIASSRMRVKIREEIGGVYSIGAYLRLKSIPDPAYSGLISFTCDPKRANEIIAHAEEILNDMSKNGIEESELAKAKKQIITSLETSKKNNMYWLSGISSYNEFGWSLDKFADKESIINSITKKEIDEIAKKYIKPYSGYTLIFAPEKNEAK